MGAGLWRFGFKCLKVAFIATIVFCMTSLKTVNLSDPVMDAMFVKDLFSGLSDRRGKIARLLTSGDLVCLRRGLYTGYSSYHPFCFAASMYGPSYVSYESALSYYGLIPEAVYAITSATLKRPATFENNFGSYIYRRVPREVYSIGIVLHDQFETPVLMASPSKALCDRIALEPRMRSLSAVQHWWELMRFNTDISIDRHELTACAERYARPSVRLLLRFLEKQGGLV